MSADLVVGQWTVKIQAKMLPYIAHQAYSLIITADGIVTPPINRSSPTKISPKLFQKCPYNETGDASIFYCNNE